MELINQIDETFKFNDKDIRVIGSYNEPWFVAKDICDILGLKNVTESLRNIPEKWRVSEILRTSYNSQNMNRNLSNNNNPGRGSGGQLSQF